MSDSIEKSLNKSDWSILDTNYTTEKLKDTQSKKTLSKISPLPKPDFSSIEKKESSFTYKQKGSYKKQKSTVPESPMKSPNQKFFTPVKLQMRNLFGDNGNACRKLNFGEEEDTEMQVEKENFAESTFKIRGNFFLENRDEEDKSTPSSVLSPDKLGAFRDQKSHQHSPMDIEDDFSQEFKENSQKAVNNFLFNLKNSNLSFDSTFNQRSSSEYFKKESRFEKEFSIIRTLDAGAFGIVYKCLNKTDNLICAVKKSKKHSSLFDFNSTQNFIIDFSLYKDKNIFSNYCVNYKECWLEEEVHAHTLTENHLFIIQDFCKYGDLLDYLESLEKIGYSFNEEFYWDLIFEMFCGCMFLHFIDYIHLDIKPGNFLIDENGSVKLGDFGLARKYSLISQGEDVFEGDSGYIAPEFFGQFSSNKKKNLDFKCDVFSLGLSIMEILCKIEVPQNGVLWKNIRSQSFNIPKEFLVNSNIKLTDEMILLIKTMLEIDPYKRPSLIEILLNSKFQNLNRRYTDLLDTKYIRSLNPRNILFDPMEDDILHFSKRSNSYKIN